jgi:hypothetical protein
VLAVKIVHRKAFLVKFGGAKLARNNEVRDNFGPNPLGHGHFLVILPVNALIWNHQTSSICDCLTKK